MIALCQMATLLLAFDGASALVQDQPPARTTIEIRLSLGETVLLPAPHGGRIKTVHVSRANVVRVEPLDVYTLAVTGVGVGVTRLTIVEEPAEKGPQPDGKRP